MSKVNIKFGDIDTQYNGDGDFAEWLRKLELVADLQGIEAMEKFLPLFSLEGRSRCMRVWQKTFGRILAN